VVDGQPAQSREAIEIRDRLIEKLASLPPVQTALDQILHYFGTDQVAEVTGRNRRIVKKVTDGHARLAVENRPGSATLAETQSFMGDKKRILIFSDAGGTGRSYHADLSARNQRKRVHYMLEPGWKADTAIQGLGRSNRTNQAQPPLFRPVATNVKGEKRHHRQTPRQPWRDHARAKANRRPGPVPARGQSRKPLCTRRARRALHRRPSCTSSSLPFERSSTAEQSAISFGSHVLFSENAKSMANQQSQVATSPTAASSF
jgi:hypothetical protein